MWNQEKKTPLLFHYYLYMCARLYIEHRGKEGETAAFDFN